MSTYLLAVALAAAPTTAAVADTAELATLAVVESSVPVTLAVVLMVVQPETSAAKAAQSMGTIRNASSLDWRNCPRKGPDTQVAKREM